MHDPEQLRALHRARFHAEPQVFVAPGRVNLIGEHTDYAEGFVMPAAIDFATLAAISPRTDGKIVLYAENYSEERIFDAKALPVKAANHWSDYLLGVVAILQGEGHTIPAFSLSLWGDVPLASGQWPSRGISRSCACPATTPRARANGARSRCKAARTMRRIVKCRRVT